MDVDDESFSVSVDLDSDDSVPSYPSTPQATSSRYADSPQPHFGDSPQPTLPRLTLKLPSLKSLHATTHNKPSKSHTGVSKRKRGTKNSGYELQYGVPPLPKAPRPVKLKPLKEVLSKIIAQIKRKDAYAFFLSPVDVSLVPGYTDVVKHPMDLGTMASKVERGRYRSLEEFTSDLKLVTGNAKSFNPPGSIYHTEAERIEAAGLDLIARSAGTVIQYETEWTVDVVGDNEIEGVSDGAFDSNQAMDVDEAIPELTATATGTEEDFGRRRSTRAPYKKPAPAAPKTSVSESIEDGRLPGSKDGLGDFPPGSDWARVMLELKVKGKRYRTKKERLRFEKEGPPYAADGSLDYAETEDPFSILSVLVPDERPARLGLVPIYSTAPSTTTTSASTPQFLSAGTPPPNADSTPQPQPPSYPIPVTLPPTRPSLIINNPPTRKHWNLVKGITTRAKGREEGYEVIREKDRRQREAHPVDWGSFACVEGELWESGEELKQMLEETATEDESYIQDTVYGGVDGLAYVKSLSEFVGQTGWLAEWVEENIVNPIVGGPHLSEKIDMEALIRRPEELFESEEAWQGKMFVKREQVLETSKELGVVLEYVAGKLKDLAAVGGERTDDDEEMKNLRMNLLALAKRAPLDSIASLPTELIPEHIRGLLR
ncbi:uncharacterized protein BT62DRAFT_946189 [Guyanagaster necrorhizus]|uniref:Bromo domain-containing protein n=1 Tax=Guyanagaster necrorhizus TaxID=856835 RepID=A0A9P7VXA4_9AGAR|nr:uncharacterized protein BT62DRAFT_946189 [Guyanagaster necrorhizus MCA 3950]KAG7448622.1 hypothetical protein BT62DRAFT_946189 [Guyanagaster necrorhizus MCA 3950]